VTGGGVAWVEPPVDFSTGAGGTPARGVHGQGVVDRPRELVDRGQVAKAHDYCASALRDSTGSSAQRSR